MEVPGHIERVVERKVDLLGSEHDARAIVAVGQRRHRNERFLKTGEPTEDLVSVGQAVVEALRAVNRGVATKQVKERKDIYQPFLFAGLLLLVIEVAIGTRRRQRYPEAS